MRRLFHLLWFVLFTTGLLLSGKAQVDLSKRLSIYFDTDASEIDATARQLIRQSILEIGPVNLRQIYIQGFTDTFASHEYNSELAKKRALNAKKYLHSQGVPSSRLLMESFGEAKSNTGSNKENRRVDLTFLYVSNNYFNFEQRPFAIKAQVYDKKSGRPITASVVLEVKEGNRYFKTNRKGVIILNNTHQGFINVSRSGYLNASKDISKVIRQEASDVDTLFIQIPLQPVEVVEKLRFKSIYFYTDSDKFKPEATPELIKLVALLRNNTDLYIEIQGHMNFPLSRRSNETLRRYNYDLSYRRARAVYDYLVANGIDESRLTYKGRSNFNMIYPNPSNREQEDQNKRVEIWKLKLR
jgi:outer membrane protein OmpA-like peptidoglycan-associated protein